MESLSFGSEEREIKREREVEEERGRMWVEGGVRGGGKELEYLERGSEGGKELEYLEQGSEGRERAGIFGAGE